jgi:hypothetical protein
MAMRGNIRAPAVKPAIPVQLIRGALIGAVVVLVVGAGLGELIEGLAPAPVLIVTAIAGAIFGAYAGGAISYDRRTRAPIDRAG